MSREAPSTNAGTIATQGLYDERKIRTYVQNFILPKYKNLDEEETVVLFSILVNSGQLQPNSKLPKLNNSDEEETVVLFSMLVNFDQHHRTIWSGKWDWDREFEWDWERFFENCEEGETSLTKPRVTKVWFNYAFERGIERVFEMQLFERLPKLEDLSFDCDQTLSLTEIISRLPNLKSLLCRKGLWRNGERQFVDIGPLSLLSGKRPSNLEKLVLQHYTIQEHHLESFLFGLLPFLPNLSTFRVDYNKLDGLRQVGQKIQDSIKSNELPRSRIRKFDLGFTVVLGGTIMPWSSRAENVNAAEILLLAFPELDDIGSKFLSNNYWCQHSGKIVTVDMDARIQYLLDINRAGRVLVEVAGAHSATTSLPLSVWPTVLERTNGRPDGIYYLLQNVPALREGGDKRDCNHHNQPKRRRLV